MPADDAQSSTLLLTDTATSVHARECVDCVEAAPGTDDLGDIDLVVVALAGSAARWLERWCDAATAPERATFVVVDDDDAWIAGHPRDRLAAASAADTAVDVELTDSAGNLTDLGVTLTDVLERYRDADRPTVLCFQSVTVLLQYADDDVVYRFLHTLTAHLQTVGAEGHFHLHEAAHEERTVARIRPLFDRIERTAMDPA